MQPLYLPFQKNPQVIAIGTRPLDMSNWIETDEHFSTYYKNKLDLHQKHPERVFSALDESIEAQHELRNRLLDHLTRVHSNIYTLDDQSCLKHHGITHPDAPNADFWQTSLWVQEDICLLQKLSDQYHLSAASLCAPSEWHLEEKIGQPISAIHSPVPQLNSQIGKQIDHIFEKLSPLRPYERFNWSVKSSNSLALFPDQSPATGSTLYLRVERQTLTRLPTSQAIAFTIKVYLYPLSLLAPIPNVLTGLLDAVHAMPPEQVRYKSMDRLYPALRTFCKQNAN